MCLLILAGGKSSRFGGFPKVFAEISDGLTNLQNTLNVTKGMFEKVYLGLSPEIIDSDYINKVPEGVDVISVSSGLGDGHSLLTAFDKIQQSDDSVERVTVVWGDAVLLDNSPIQVLLETETDTPFKVAVCDDIDPYAWFDVDSDMCVKSAHFKSVEGPLICGLHDQSVFNLGIKEACKVLIAEFLYCYSEEVGKTRECKLLNALSNTHKMCRAVIVPSDKVLSFNSVTELDGIKTLLNSIGGNTNA